MENRKHSSSKYIILILAFAVTAAATFLSMNFKAESAVTTTMKQAALPVIYMQTEEGTMFNRLQGYTRQIDPSEENESLTPLPSDKNLPIVIDTYNEKVTGVAYRIRSLEELSLIEYTQVEDYTIQDKSVYAVFNIKNLIEDNKEYLLEIELSTEKHESIRYYTHIIGGTFSGLQEKLDFILEFNANIYDTANIKNIVKYLETNSSGSNDNYGAVNINSTQSTVGWGDISPFIESDRVPMIKSISNDIAEVTLDYRVGAENEYGGYDTYSVSEDYRIRQAGTSIYLLGYDRTASQIFDGINDFTTSSKINMGIQPDTKITAQANEAGTHTLFVNNGVLWELSNADNAFTRVFAFEAEDSDNIRERVLKYDIRIMSVAENGDCQFLVCGYMPRGEHEGEVGVSLFSYNYEQNQVTEEIFIPIDLPYKDMIDKVGEAAYVGENDLFYILIEDTLYAINLVSREVMVEVAGLVPETYAVASTGNCIAYSTNGKLYDTDTIRIFNMEKAQDYEIQAEEGKKLRILGYINTDLIYGSAWAEDIISHEESQAMFPMDKICIINSDYELVKEYSEENIYVTNTEINNQRINLYRVRFTEDGYESIVMDQLINREENSKNGVSTDTINTDDKKLEVIIVLQNAVSSIENTSVRFSESVIFKKDEDFSLKMHTGE